MPVVDIIQALADHYPLEDLLIQNDIEEYTVIKWLIDEGHIDPNDYFYEDEEEIGDYD